MSTFHENDPEWVDSLENAHTNFFTNTVKLGLTDEELAFLITNRLPVSCAPKVIHEAVHHWFFQTMVGESIALAKMAACEYMKSGDQTAAIDLVVRYGCLLNLLRPIFEGAALLGEFDVLPMAESQSPIPPHQLLPLLFSRSTRNMPSLLKGCKSHLVAAMLIELRSFKCFSSEKLRMFNTKGLNAVNYLLGYHDVRQWWTIFRLGKSGGHYNDGTLFLKLVYVYFFCDFKLASLIFEKRSSTEEAVEAICGYISRRVAFFESLANSSAVAEKFADPSGELVIHELQELGVFEPDSHEGLTASGKEMMLVFGNRQLDRETLPPLRIQHNRKPFHLASVPIRCICSRKQLRVETLSGTQLLSAELDGDGGSVTKEGHLSSLIFMSELVLSHTFEVADCALYRTFYSPDDVSEEVRAQIRKLTVDRDDIEATAAAMEGALRNALSSHGTAQRLFNRCEDVKRNIYGFAGCPKENLVAARIWLNGIVKNGLGDSFPDESWARALVLLGSSRARLEFDAGHPAELLSANGIDPAILSKLEAISSPAQWGCEAFGWRFYITGRKGDWWPMI